MKGRVWVMFEFELAPVDSPTRAATTAARLARSRVVRLLCHHLLCVSANWLFTHTVPPSSGPPSASPRRASMVVAMLVASTRPPVSNASLAWVVRAELCGGAVVPQLCACRRLRQQGQVLRSGGRLLCASASPLACGSSEHSWIAAQSTCAQREV